MKGSIKVGCILSGLMVLVGLMAGCASRGGSEGQAPVVVYAPTDQAAAPAVAVAPAPAETTAHEGEAYASMAFPVDRPYSRVLLLEKLSPAEVPVGLPCEYTLRVTNLTDTTITKVVVSECYPDAFELQASAPQAYLTAGGMGRCSGVVGAGSDATRLGPGSVARWCVGTLAPKASETIRVRGVARAPGQLTFNAKVNYCDTMDSSLTVVEPKLQLTLAVPAEAQVDQVIPLQLVVTNAGTGGVRNTRVSSTLPAGMTLLDGGRTVAFEAGTLATGQSRELSTQVKAASTGTYEIMAVAAGDGGLLADANGTVVVRQAVLGLAITGQQQQILGRQLPYEIAVTNTGDMPATGVELITPVPAGTSFVRASDGGAFVNGRVGWAVGALDVGEVRKVALTLRADQIGTVVARASAAGVGVSPAVAEVRTEVSGVAGVLFEVADAQDPVEVDGEVVYLVTVTNQGFAPCTNVAISCVLEENMSYVSSGGPTAGTEQNRVITFDALPSLGSKSKATWKVVAKAVKAGDVRFKAAMTSDQLTRPVEKSEATKVY
jgi:uncharacterized repeat protein (TIGR01451 family)